MKKIACIIGTRPQLIKHSVLLKELERFFSVQTLNTLQHYQYELNDLFQKELYTDHKFYSVKIEPELPPNGRLGKMIFEISCFINQFKPDAILIYGDTDSTLAGALATNKASIPLIHIEAGERSFNREMPEEINRVITDHLADIHFCVSEKSIANLASERLLKKVFCSGDVMKDLLMQKSLSISRPFTEPYLFCTIHRNYNRNNPEKLHDLLKTLSTLEKKIFFSVHPATLQTITANKIPVHHFENIQIMPPLSYSQSISYQKFAAAVITDSGAIQKEAYWLKRPCITIRKETEWTETLIGNWNQLIYQELHKIPDMLKNIPVESLYNYGLYGNGKASFFIAETLSTII
jgi:UDP-GlcNAc3NAcA epimerase